MISFARTTMTLLCWHLMRDTISRHFTLPHVNVMKVSLEILLLVFRTSRTLIETGLRLNLFVGFHQNCSSISETLYTPVWSDNTNTYIYTCRRSSHNNILSCKTSFYTFLWVGEFWKTSFEKTQSWQCLSCFIHSLNLTKQNWHNTYKVILKRCSEPN